MESYYQDSYIEHGKILCMMMNKKIIKTKMKRSKCHIILCAMGKYKVVASNIQCHSIFR